MGLEEDYSQAEHRIIINLWNDVKKLKKQFEEFELLAKKVLPYNCCFVKRRIYKFKYNKKYVIVSTMKFFVLI